MERLRGRTLGEALEVGPVPAADLASILRGVASALSAAHATGVVHGALRADAVFLAEVPGYRWGFPKVLDFGVARLDAAGQSDARANQRALAALAARAHGRPFPPAAQRVLDRAAGSDAEQPFASATSFVEALEEALAVASVAAAPPPAAAAALPVAAAAPPMAAAALPVAAAAAPVAVAAAPVAANPPSSLTQQFFAEGDKQEVVHAAEDDDLDEDAPAASAALIPRNRAQIAAAIVLAFGAVGIIVGTLVSLSTARDASPPAPVAVQRPVDVPASTPRAPAAAPAGAARASGQASPAHRERSHQGRTAAPRARLVEPSRFVPSSVAAPAPPPPGPWAAPAPAAPAPAAAETPAPTPTPPAADDTSVVNEDDDTQPEQQTEAETAPPQ